MTEKQAKAELTFAKCVIEFMKIRLELGYPITFKQAVEIMERTMKPVAQQPAKRTKSQKIILDFGRDSR